MRARFADMPQLEIPVVERPVLFRAVGQRATPAVASDTPHTEARQAAAGRSAPRIQMQAGVRIFRGS